MNSREENIILDHIYEKSEYQRRLLSVACLIWGLLDIMSLSLGLLELKPIVDVYDKISGNIIFHGPLRYEYCESQGTSTFYIVRKISENSLVVYFDIYCNKYLVAMIGSCNFFGVLVGTLISPFIVDHYGRRKPIIIACGIYSILIFLATFSPNIYIMLFFIFICGFTNLIAHISVFLLLNEVTKKEKRAKYSSIIFNSFALFGIIYVWSFYYIRYWKYVFYMVALNTVILFLLTNLFIKESPRFLLLKKDKNFKANMLRRIFNYGKEVEYFAEIMEDKNKRKVFNFLDRDEGIGKLKVNLLDKTSEEGELCKFVLGNLNRGRSDTLEDENEMSKANLNEDKGSVWLLVKNPNINYIFFTMCFMWFCISGSYYGILLLAKDMKGNIYITYTMMFVLEIFSNIVASVMMEHPELGRKYSMSLLFLIAISFILVKLLFDISEYMTMFLTLLRFIISIIYSIIYVYCIESYPTDIRAKGLAFNAVFGRLSSILVPFLVEILGEKFFIYCLVIFTCSFLLSFLIKETYNTELEQYTKTSND
jgi:MFS family permease